MVATAQMSTPLVYSVEPSKISVQKDKKEDKTSQGECSKNNCGWLVPISQEENRQQEQLTNIKGK